MIKFKFVRRNLIFASQNYYRSYIYIYSQAQILQHAIFAMTGQSIERNTRTDEMLSLTNDIRIGLFLCWLLFDIGASMATLVMGVVS